MNEELLQAARREFQEETGIDKYRKMVRLESICSIPTEKVVSADYWKDTFVVTEFSFAAELFDKCDKYIPWNELTCAAEN